LLGALHETGQALYDLGLPAEWVDQPVGQDRGMAIEESQSLLLEMMVGRSRAFVTFLRPLLEKYYGAAGPEWTEENIFRYLNRVARGTSRMDADELTYQTHIWLRYELERRLLSGELAVKELREAWNALSADRLGLVPANDVEGCLQDIHWAIGSFGHFPSYGVGAVIAGQLWETIREQQPGVEAEIATGHFGSLLAWLRERVHSMGASLGVPQLVQHATGRPLSAAPFLRYLERKYLAES
jgi:carboxypeptidase Taq